ncbi:DUF6316 family protein [Gilvimarinus sp. F26214L]|uniref:DUF6316 family protein n=1 Tax=Gilvimarinus sp. DZF01 TaxID=3461371 RepID=UPI00404668D3
MKFNRTGEQGNVPARTDRFFTSNDYWYYTTREGVDIGPFDSFEDAANGANEFIDFICGAEPSFSETLELYSRRNVA